MGYLVWALVLATATQSDAVFQGDDLVGEQSPPPPPPPPLLSKNDLSLAADWSRPVFIAGCGHSGTSLALRLIGRQRSFFMFGNETCALCRIGRGLAPGEGIMGDYQRAAERLSKLDTIFLERRKQQEVRWVEKTPLHINYVGKALLLRPGAQIILMVRDGRDVVASLKGRRNPRNAAIAVEEGLARWYSNNYRALYWEKVEVERAKALHTDSRILVVRYDQLVENTTETLKAIFRFLRVGFNEKHILSYYKDKEKFNAVGFHNVHLADPILMAAGVTVTIDSERGVNHDLLRAHQFNMPLFNGAGRWKEAPPRGLTPSERDLLQHNASFMQMMYRLGYATSPSGDVFG